jgi:hypothetical protein
VVRITLLWLSHILLQLCPGFTRLLFAMLIVVPGPLALLLVFIPGEIINLRFYGPSLPANIILSWLLILLSLL